MQIGVCVHHRANIRQAFQDIIDAGFQQCQLISWDSRLWSSADADLINQITAELSIQITAFWCGWSGPAVWNFTDGYQTLGLVPETYREQRKAELMQGADFAKSIHVRDVVTHVGFLPEDPNQPLYSQMVDSVRDIAAHCEKNGQRFLFETGQETPLTLLRTIEDIGLGNVGINLDTGNLILYGKGNPLDALDVFGKYVMGVHLKDAVYPTSGYQLGREMKIGDGKVDFKSVLHRLHELGYDGSLTIERGIDGAEQLRDILDGKSLMERFLR